MYCHKCGTQIAISSNYCHLCGTPLPQEKNLSRKSAWEEERQRLAESLLAIDTKPHECHGCGSKQDLYKWDFGLGRSLSSERAWGETAASVVLSAVTIPFLGAGMLRLPGKSTRYRVLRLQLVLCNSCRGGHINYGLHPWWVPAQKLGYSTFLSAKELDKMTPT
jgi:hypothetical protein